MSLQAVPLQKPETSSDTRPHPNHQAIVRRSTRIEKTTRLPSERSRTIASKVEPVNSRVIPDTLGAASASAALDESALSAALRRSFRRDRDAFSLQFALSYCLSFFDDLRTLESGKPCSPASAEPRYISPACRSRFASSVHPRRAQQLSATSRR